MPNRIPHRRIASHYALTPQGLIPWGLITLDQNGTIISVESKEGVDSHYGVEFYSGILIPGMVNAHTHLELSYLKGSIKQGGGFVGFANELSAARNLFSQQEMEHSADYQDARMYVEGISAAGDISNGSLTFRVKQQSKIFYHTFLELYGLNAKAGSLDLLSENVRSESLTGTITPHSTYSLNDAPFRDAVGGAENSPLSIHFMESREEEELYLGRGTMKEWYDKLGMMTDFTDMYASPAERIVSCIPAERRILLVHNTFITQREIEMLMRHFGKNVTFVLCPRSNRYITGELPPVAMLKEAGVRIAIGTDSLASNTSLSMIEELKMLSDIPLEDRLAWATIGGAEALGIEERYGSLEVGKNSGIVLLDGIDWAKMELLPEATTRRLA